MKQQIKLPVLPKIMISLNKLVLDLNRDQNKAGPQANCPKNLVRASKMFRSRAQLALENGG